MSMPILIKIISYGKFWSQNLTWPKAMSLEMTLDKAIIILFKPSTGAERRGGHKPLELPDTFIFTILDKEI